MVVTPLALTAATLPAATAGVAYSATLAATGGVAPYSWSIPVGSLPAGLRLHAATGVISGTPTAGGNFTFTAEVTDSEAEAQVSSASEAITVGVSGLVVTTGSTLPTATSGVPYSVKLGAAGGVTPYQWSLASGSLPAGLKLKSTGVISGTTTATGPDSFTVQVTDAEAPAVSATENVSLSVVTPMVVEGSTLVGATAGEQYDSGLFTSGGLAPYSYAITAGSLPPGLALLPDGEVTGVPTGPGGFNFTVSVTDSENPPATVTQADYIMVLLAPKASPALSTTPNQVNGPVGTVLQDTATLTGSSGATGSIEFKLYPTADCSGPPADDETVPVAGDGSYATTTGYTAAAAGTYQWTASYSGDIGNNPAASGCGAEQVEISPAPALYWTDGLGDIPTVTVIGGVPTAPHVVVNDQNGPAWVAASGGTVYWADRGTGAIMAVPVAGGTPTALASGQNDPTDVAVDNGTVYWADSSVTDGAIMAVPVTGGTPVVLASGQPDPISLTASGGVVYWIDRGSREIMEEPEGNGGEVYQILVDDPGAPVDLAAGGGFVYWADSVTGQVMAMYAGTGGGGTPFVLASNQDNAAYLTVGGGTVYWADAADAEIWAVTLTGGIPTSSQVLVDDQNGPAYLAADDGGLYWIDTSTDQIMTFSNAGNNPHGVVLANVNAGAAYLAADG